MSKYYCFSHSRASRIQKFFLSANHGGQQYFSVFHGPLTLKSISPALRKCAELKCAWGKFVTIFQLLFYISEEVKCECASALSYLLDFSKKIFKKKTVSHVLPFLRGLKLQATLKKTLSCCIINIFFKNQKKFLNVFGFDCFLQFFLLR